MVTIEEKATLYDEALEKATAWYNDSKGFTELQKMLEGIFPSLKHDVKESIIVLAYEALDKREISNEEYNEIFDWVKKQGESVEWSEEDIEILNRISVILNDARQVREWWKEDRLITKEESDKLINWLKSLKDRVQPR